MIFLAQVCDVAAGLTLEQGNQCHHTLKRPPAAKIPPQTAAEATPALLHCSVGAYLEVGTSCQPKPWMC